MTQPIRTANNNTLCGQLCIHWRMREGQSSHAGREGNVGRSITEGPRASGPKTSTASAWKTTPAVAASNKRTAPGFRDGGTTWPFIACELGVDCVSCRQPLAFFSSCHLARYRLPAVRRRSSADCLAQRAQGFASFRRDSRAQTAHENTFRFSLLIPSQPSSHLSTSSLFRVAFLRSPFRLRCRSPSIVNSERAKKQPSHQSSFFPYN